MPWRFFYFLCASLLRDGESRSKTNISYNGDKYYSQVTIINVQY